ncbi:MAG: signal peptide peptidase SppA [Candidatus Marinimicrobia bacterium]|nr:signal peptide peptidase SppA [Candidatus Neomarinimicrobiota bacterium]MCF7840676.1 signal peptide peptidase SppA [Candidatus Neomarinimicrobiota bacterium]
MADTSPRRNPRRYGGWIFILVVIVILVIWFSLQSDEKYPAAVNVGVLPLKGMIVESQPWIEKLDDFVENRRIGAILIDIDSPGGAVTPSYEMYMALKKAGERTEKPIVVSMGSLAASGGYMIALGGDTIIANPTSVTGSIGVIMNFPDFTELMDDLGVRMNVVKTGPFKDSGSPYRHMTDQDVDYYEGVIGDVFSQFKEIVARERDLSMPEVETLADGRVFSGRQALDEGLVDALGTFHDAKIIACEMSGLAPDIPLVYPPRERRSFLRLILDDVSGAIPDWSRWTSTVVQYRMP